MVILFVGFLRVYFDLYICENRCIKTRSGNFELF